MIPLRYGPFFGGGAKGPLAIGLNLDDPQGFVGALSKMIGTNRD